MFAAEMLGGHDKLIDARQVAAVLERLGISADVEEVRVELNNLAEERPPRLIRGAKRIVRDGADEVLLYFVLP